MTPNSEATSWAGSALVSPLAIAAPRTPSQKTAMNVPIAETQ